MIWFSSYIKLFSPYLAESYERFDEIACAGTDRDMPEMES